MNHLSELYERWVNPVYLWLLHGNLRGPLLAAEFSDEREEMIAAFRTCLAEVDSTVVAALLDRPDWRTRLTGSWYAGLRGWRQFTAQLGDLLLESHNGFAGQGYCAALACFADRASVDQLRRYLDAWLPQADKFDDQQVWALPALVWIEQRLETPYAAEYLAPGGLWDQWAAAHHRDGRRVYLEAQRRFDLTLASALAAFRCNQPDAPPA